MFVNSVSSRLHIFRCIRPRLASLRVSLCGIGNKQVLNCQVEFGQSERTSTHLARLAVLGRMQCPWGKKRNRSTDGYQCHWLMTGNWVHHCLVKLNTRVADSLILAIFNLWLFLSGFLLLY